MLKLVGTLLLNNTLVAFRVYDTATYDLAYPLKEIFLLKLRNGEIANAKLSATGTEIIMSDGKFEDLPVFSVRDATGADCVRNRKYVVVSEWGKSGYYVLGADEIVYKMSYEALAKSRKQYEYYNTSLLTYTGSGSVALRENATDEVMSVIDFLKKELSKLNARFTALNVPIDQRFAFLNALYNKICEKVDPEIIAGQDGLIVWADDYSITTLKNAYSKKREECTFMISKDGTQIKDRNRGVAASRISALFLPPNINVYAENALGGTDLTFVYLSNGAYFGSSCFAYAKNLRTVICNKQFESLRDSFFRDCVKLNKVVLSNNITRLPAKVFYNCTDLKRIENYATVQSIRAEAFKYSGIEEFDFSSVKAIGCRAFSGSKICTVAIPNINMLESESFMACENLKVVNLACDTKELKLDVRAFNGCNSLESVTLKGVKTIDSECFSACRSLKKFSADDALVRLRREAFKLCALTELNLSDVVQIGSGCFNMNNYLCTVNLPRVSEIDNSAFNACKSLEIVNIPVCTSIRSYAFTDCVLLKQVNSPCLKNIDYAAFRSTLSLASINLRSLEHADSEVFAGSGLTALTIGNSTISTTLEMRAFQACKKLKTVNCQSHCLDLKTSVFELCDSLKEFSACTLVADDDAFSNCYALELLNITSYRKLGSRVFANTAISTLALKAARDFILNSDTFYGMSSLESLNYFSDETKIEQKQLARDGYNSYIHPAMLEKLLNLKVFCVNHAAVRTIEAFDKNVFTRSFITYSD